MSTTQAQHIYFDSTLYICKYIIVWWTCKQLVARPISLCLCSASHHPKGASFRIDEVGSVLPYRVLNLCEKLAQHCVYTIIPLPLWAYNDIYIYTYIYMWQYDYVLLYCMQDSVGKVGLMRAPVLSQCRHRHRHCHRCSTHASITAPARLA